MELVIGGYYRHKKTGGVYQVLMTATIEATMTPAVIYGASERGVAHRWVRPLVEFCDGRFEPVEINSYRVEFEDGFVMITNHNESKKAGRRIL